MYVCSVQPFGAGIQNFDGVPKLAKGLDCKPSIPGSSPGVVSIISGCVGQLVEPLRLGRRM